MSWNHQLEIIINWRWRTPLRRVERWQASHCQGLERVLVTCSGCPRVRRRARRWARRWVFSRKTAGKHVICFPGKQPENTLPFYRAKPWQTYFVFSRNTYKEKDNVFPRETVDIKIDFFSLFPWKTMKETGFLFRMQTDGIIILCFLFICLGNGLNVFQANINFSCFPNMFPWKTVTIPSSGCCIG